MIQSNTKTKTLNLEIILFTLIRTVINSSYRMVYPLLPLFAAGLGVSIAELGIAFSIRSFLGVLGPFLAVYADIRGRKSGMLLGLGLFTVGTFFVAIWPSFFTFIVASSLVVLGNGVFIPSMQAYLSDRVPYEKRGAVISFTELSWALSFIIGIPIIGLLIEKLNWVSPFIFLGVLGLALFILLIFKIPKDANPTREKQALLGNLRSVLTFWPAVAGMLMGFFFTGANELVNLVFGVWINDSFGLAFATMTAASIVIGSSELISELLSVFVLDKLGKRRAILLALLLNSVSSVLLPLTANNLTLALLGLGFFYITFEFALISGLTMMSEVLPSARATVMAATLAAFSLGRMLGALVGPSLYGVGFWAACLGAVLLNIISLFFLTQVRLKLSSSAH